MMVRHTILREVVGTESSLRFASCLPGDPAGDPARLRLRSPARSTILPVESGIVLLRISVATVRPGNSLPRWSEI